MSNGRPNKYERSRRVEDKSDVSKLERILNPYRKIRETAENIKQDKG
jgi:hypothetical protein